MRALPPRALCRSPALLTLLLAVHAVSARLFHSLPEDTYAFPKFKVVFLNGHAVSNDTAQRWLKDGLRGGEAEFLDEQGKDEAHWQPPSLRQQIGSADAHDTAASAPDPSPESVNYTIEHMKMGPKDSYICLIPKPLDTIHEQEPDVTPARSWSLLQPLSGTCLYHRQGWFTYSYCHNEEIRQFKELSPQHARAPGPYTPEEDPEWESFTLGRAPRVTEPGADLTVAERQAEAVNLELARNAGSQYLVQRWGDGTHCKVTNKPREVEVQFHCSMTMTDHILFVKETKICSYVLVINTPRLCGEPSFQSHRDKAKEAQIRCREVVDSKSEARDDLPLADHPLKMPRRKPVLPAPQPPSAAEEAADPVKVKDQLYNELFEKILSAFPQKGMNSAPGDASGEVIIEFADDPLLEELQEETANRLVEALRAAGHDVKAQLVTGKGLKDVKGDKHGNRDKKVEQDNKDEVRSEKSNKVESKDSERTKRLMEDIDNFVRDEL